MLTELRKIRELLEKPPPPPPVHGLLQEFKAFLSQYGVLGLAVAFILGVYLGALVKALVGDLILPIIGLVMPGTTYQPEDYLQRTNLRHRGLPERGHNIPDRGLGHLPHR